MVTQKTLFSTARSLIKYNTSILIIMFVLLALPVSFVVAQTSKGDVARSVSTPLTPPITPPIPTVYDADFNHDGVVNVLDFGILRSEFGRTDCDINPCRADMNQDGSVNAIDRDYFRAFMGQSVN